MRGGDGDGAETFSDSAASPLADRIRLLASGAGPKAEDTMVGDLVLVATYRTLVEGRPIPSDFGMFSEGNSAVEARLRSLVSEVEPLLEGQAPRSGSTRSGVTRGVSTSP